MTDPFNEIVVLTSSLSSPGDMLMAAMVWCLISADTEREPPVFYVRGVPRPYPAPKPF